MYLIRHTTDRFRQISGLTDVARQLDSVMPARTMQVSRQRALCIKFMNQIKRLSVQIVFNLLGLKCGLARHTKLKLQKT